jgi:8-oxo-dGTP diphosphatase
LVREAATRSRAEAKALLAFGSGPLRYDRRDVTQQKRILADAFAGQAWEIPRLLEAMWEAADFYFDSISQVQLDRWSNGRVVLVGDAGYSPSPASGLGIATDRVIVILAVIALLLDDPAGEPTRAQSEAIAITALTIAFTAHAVLAEAWIRATRRRGRQPYRDDAGVIAEGTPAAREVRHSVSFSAAGSPVPACHRRIASCGVSSTVPPPQKANEMEQRPRVGVGVLLRHHGKVLLGKRRGSHGEGTWAPPGGHLEFKEELETCVRREVQEETGLTVMNIHFGIITNDIFDDEDRHYVTIFMICDYADGELRNMEPEKCDEWRWFRWNEIPPALFLPFQNLLKSGFTPFVS